MWSVAFANAGEDAGGTEIRQTLLEARDGLPPDFTRNQGWVLTAFGNAFHRLWREQDLAEALVETVMAGGDTDTNAAIAGALLGAVYGRDAIPHAWRMQVLGCRAVRGEGVVNPRPSDYWADDAMELAEALLNLPSFTMTGHAGKENAASHEDDRTDEYDASCTPSSTDGAWLGLTSEKHLSITFQDEDGNPETMRFPALNSQLDIVANMLERGLIEVKYDAGSDGTYNLLCKDTERELPSLRDRPIVQSLITTWANEMLDRFVKVDEEAFVNWLESRCRDMNQLFLGFMSGESSANYKRSEWNTPQKLGTFICTNMGIETEINHAVRDAFRITALRLLRAVTELQGKPAAWTRLTNSLVEALTCALVGASICDEG